MQILFSSRRWPSINMNGIHWDTWNPECKMQHISTQKTQERDFEQSIEGKSWKNRNSNTNPTVDNSDKYKIHYFHAGLEMNTDKEANAELT